MEDDVALLDIHHAIPDNTTKLADLKYLDSGLSTDCSFNSLMYKAKVEARKLGANIVKVVQKKKPDLWSSCYRLTIELHKYDGEVSVLHQYSLSLD